MIKKIYHLPTLNRSVEAVSVKEAVEKAMPKVSKAKKKDTASSIKDRQTLTIDGNSTRKTE